LGPTIVRGGASLSEIEPSSVDLIVKGAQVTPKELLSVLRDREWSTVEIRNEVGLTRAHAEALCANHKLLRLIVEGRCPPDWFATIAEHRSLRELRLSPSGGRLPALPSLSRLTLCLDLQYSTDASSLSGANISNLELVDAGLAHLSLLPFIAGLTSLTLRDADEPGPSGLAHVAKCDTLSSLTLRLSYADGLLTKSGVRAIGANASLRSLTLMKLRAALISPSDLAGLRDSKLTRLVLELPRWSDFDAGFMPAGLQELSLHFHQSRGLAPPRMAAGGEDLRDLKLLEITTRDKFSAAYIKPFSKLPALEHIRIRGEYRLGALRPLLSSPSLRRLSVKMLPIGLKPLQDGQVALREFFTKPGCQVAIYYDHMEWSDEPVALWRS